MPNENPAFPLPKDDGIVVLVPSPVLVLEAVVFDVELPNEKPPFPAEADGFVVELPNENPGVVLEPGVAAFVVAAGLPNENPPLVPPFDVLTPVLVFVFVFAFPNEKAGLVGWLVDTVAPPPKENPVPVPALPAPLVVLLDPNIDAPTVSLKKRTRFLFTQCYTRET